MSSREETAALVERDPYTLLDREDEAALIAEMSGAIVEAYVYEVEVWDPKEKRKKKAHQLSKPGVDAVCREVAKRGEVIREIEMEHTVDWNREEAFFRVKAGRYRLNDDGTETLLDTAYGVKRQPMVFVSRRGEKSPNQHWYEHGAMKACRNARRRLIPETVAVELIKRWSGESGRVTRVGYDDEAPPPARTATPAPRHERADDGSTEADRKSALAEVTRELDAAFGDGDPSDDPHKSAVLRTVFRLSDWRSLQNMPLATFLGRYSHSRLMDAITIELEGA